MPHSAAADNARDRNRALFDGVFGGLYSFYIERERLCRLIAALVWGGDSRPFYASMRSIGEVRQGGLIVDAPCGAGVAFRGLRPDQRVRYVALDLSPRTLALARRRATRRGLGQIEFGAGDAQVIPVEEGSVDLFLSYWGLHCFPDPARALAETARCLCRGGRVVGSMITRGHTARHRLLVRPGVGGFGPAGTADDLRRWLGDARLRDVTVETRGSSPTSKPSRPHEARPEAQPATADRQGSPGNATRPAPARVEASVSAVRSLAPAPDELRAS